MREPIHQIIRRKRATEKIALQGVTLIDAQKVHLFLSLHAFSNNLHAELVAYLDCLLSNDTIPFITVKILDE